MVQCNYDLAHRFVQRILEREPANAEAREMSAVIDLERGEIESAREVSIVLDCEPSVKRVIRCLG